MTATQLRYRRYLRQTRLTFAIAEFFGESPQFTDCEFTFILRSVTIFAREPDADLADPVGPGLNPAHAIANTRRMTPSANDDLCRFTAFNHDLLGFDCPADIVLRRSADRLEKSPLRTASLLQEAH
jgi:hypothetical protein